ncbi:hypothetical protein H4S07_006541, partial [Coemansia furcata]
IASDDNNSPWIKWSEAGDQIMIGSWDNLIDKLLEMNFSTTKRESIMKNFYGYRFKLDSDGRTRIPDDNGNEWSILHHEKFLRGRPELLRDIKRAPAPPRRH